MSGHTNQLRGWRYEALQQAIVFHSTTTAMPWAKLWQSPANHVFQVGDSYKLTYELKDIPAANMYGGGNVKPLLGRVKGRIVINGNNYDFTYRDTVDTHVETIVLENSSSTSSTYYNNHFYIQTDGNQECRGMVDAIKLEWVEAPNARVKIKVTNIDLNPPTQQNLSLSAPLNYMVDKYVDTGSLFKDKLVRFSYRYKYLDGEFSPFAPFTGVAFSPGNFDYNPIKGYNLGMVNQLKSLELRGFVPSDIGDGVVAIDILAKIEDSPIIYLVDTIRQTDLVPKNKTLNPWDSNTYTITSDTVKGALPANQLLRPWDNVPKQALAQEIVGNRLVYANYKQGYDLVNSSGAKYKPEFNVSIDNSDSDLTQKRSIKSSRDYQLGVVFSDDYGRETPVLSNGTGSFHVNTLMASNSNVIQATFQNQDYPVDAKYYKFFVKETAGEYYNVAMGRHYTDDDGDVWLAFPSSERNKVDIDTFLTLKKGADTNLQVQENAKYKVLSIENEAPDFIKVSQRFIEQKTHDLSPVAAADDIDLFGEDLIDAPIEGKDNFKMNYNPFVDSSGNMLHEINDGELYVDFSNAAGKISRRYKINRISSDIGIDSMAATNASYSIKLKEALGDDVNFITDDISGDNSTKIIDGTTVNIYNYVKDDGTASFDGRFFVKIQVDDAFTSNIKSSAAEGDRQYNVLSSKKLFFMNSDFADHPGSAVKGHSSTITGLTEGAYDTEGATYGGRGTAGKSYINYKGNDFNGQYGNGWEDITAFGEGHRDFSKFAVFFRNYKYASGSETLLLADGTTAESVGQYKFGTIPGAWATEFKNYTSRGDYWKDGYDTTGYDAANNWIGRPIADKAADERQKDDEVWFIDKGPFIAHRGSSDSLHWQWIRGTAYSTPSLGADYTSKTGIQTNQSSGTWTMDVAMGGIYKDGIGSTNADFFGPNNPYYQDSETIDIVNKHNPGTQFRFRQDPTETVYTILPSTTFARVIRYSANYDYADQMLLNEYQAPRLSPNFTNNRKIKCTPQIAWDPTMGGTLGAIENGYEVSVNAVAFSSVTTGNATASTMDEYFIYIASNLGTDPVYGTVLITVGMIVTENNGNPLANPLIVKAIEPISTGFKVFLCGYGKLLETTDTFTPVDGQPVKFQQPAMNGYSENSTNRINQHASYFSIDKPGLKAVGYTVDFLNEIQGEQAIPDNPAVFETEPKLNSSSDIYYEASGANPIELNEGTIETAIPIGSIITSDLNDPGFSFTGSNSYIPDNTIIIGHTNGNTVLLSNTVPVETENTPGAYPVIITAGVNVGKNYRITRPNGTSIYVTIEHVIQTQAEVIAKTTIELRLKKSLLNGRHSLTWHNCYSFGNGVESNRIRDVFNAQYISNGVKASSTLSEDFGEQHRKYGLIFSGIYNSNSSTNNLNQFIQAEAITKDVNPTYGSIQKLYTRDSDLLALCEDKCLRILANKDALYNADGNPQLTANQNVLGQTIPFSGEFGISKNPESFASESYRVYFADRVRGAILRLSKDGLTPISDHGMKDWFRDNLSLGVTNLLGESNLDSINNWNIPQPDGGSGGGNSFVENGVATLGYFNNNIHDIRYGRPAYLKMDNILEIGKKYRLQFDIIEHSGLMRENGTNSSVTINNSPPYGGWVGTSGMSNSTTNGAHVNVEWTANTTDFQLLQYQVNYRHDVDLDGSGAFEASNANGINEINLTGYYSDPNGGGVVSIQDYVNALRVAAGLPDLFGPELIQDPNFDEVPTLWVTLDDGSYNPAIFTTGQCELTGLNRINTANDILLPNTDYTLEYEVTANSNPGNLQYWQGVNFITVDSMIGTHTVSFTTGPAFTNPLGTNFYIRHQGALDSTDSVTLTSVSLRVDGSDNIPDDGDYGWQSYLYGGTVTIKNLLLEEAKEKPITIVGSHDDRQNEYNITIHGANSNTVSFKEDVRGWVSFKSFIPENGISCANDYYTMLNGKLWQHHNPGTNRNTFYNTFSNSSINVLLNDGPGSVKSFHTLDYEGSQSKIDLNVGDNEYYNLTAKDGWYVGHIETDKQKGSLNEFIEKEGKWFNYIKGIDSDISVDTDFGAFDVQGIGMLVDVSSGVLTFSGAINSSLQIGDTIYYRQPNSYNGFSILDHNGITKCGNVTGITSNTITVGDINAMPLVGDFILFAKNNAINTSSLLGYYADVKLENNSKVRAEIFSIGAEVTGSSK